VFNDLSQNYYWRLNAQKHTFILKHNVCKQSRRCIIWGGKEKDRGTLIKSLINAIVDRVAGGHTIIDLKRLCLNDQKSVSS